MSKSGHYTKEEAKQLKGDSDLERLKSMTDKDIRKAVAEDPDAPRILTDKDYEKLNKAGKISRGRYVPRSQRLKEAEEAQKKGD